MKAATRDASWYASPSVDKPVKYHVAIVAGSNSRHGGDDMTSACDGAPLADFMAQEAKDVPEYQRCQRPGCKRRWPRP